MGDESGIESAPPAGIDLIGDGIDHQAVGLQVARPEFVSPEEVAAAEAAAKEAIERFYVDNGGIRGPFGFPLEDVTFRGSEASQRYSGGTIKFLDNTPKGEKLTCVRVRYVGFHCLAESDWDQASSADEPYFIIGVAGANNSNTVRFGPYEDVDKGESRFEAAYVAATDHAITPPIALGVVGMENDYGTPEEAEGKVRKVIEEVERKFEQAAGGLAGVSTGSHVMPEWARDILIGWVPEGFAAVFGMGDDEVGRTPVVIFDNKADLATWTQLPVLGKHGPNEYNQVIHVGDGDEGSYNLFFKVDLFFKDEGPEP